MKLEKLKTMQKLNQEELNFIFGATALAESQTQDVSSDRNDSYSNDSKKDDKPKTVTAA
jgi:hypothetical protein